MGEGHQADLIPIDVADAVMIGGGGPPDGTGGPPVPLQSREVCNMTRRVLAVAVLGAAAWLAGSPVDAWAFGKKNKYVAGDFGSCG